MENFVPYIYLDGHRSSCVGTDREGYVEGAQFFFRLARIAKARGIKDIVVMIHTERNQDDRVQSVGKAILNQALPIALEGIDFGFRFYGNFERYRGTTLGLLLKIGYFSRCIGSQHTKIHMLLNYSEKWATINLHALDKMPNISTVIRFTKGYYSGGWLPEKMAKTTFVYCQTPSVSFHWSDEEISKLLAIAEDNWREVSKFIGNSEYSVEYDKSIIHDKRDKKLHIEMKRDCAIAIPTKRVVAFSLTGPEIYEF